MASSSSSSPQQGVQEQDQYMPIANVIRIMRRILPSHAKISDDAKETIQECVSEYISFITAEANDRCQREQRKTVTAEDVLWAMGKLGFDDYVGPLSLYLHRYRQTEGEPAAVRRTIAAAPPSASNYGAHSLPLPPPPPPMQPPAGNSGCGSGFPGGGGVFDQSANASGMMGGFYRDDGSAGFDPFAPHIKRDRLGFDVNADKMMIGGTGLPMRKGCMLMQSWSMS